MAVVVKYKNEFANKRLAFGTNANPLHRRTQDELIGIAISALESKDPSLLKLFQELPPLLDLKKAKTDQQLKKIVPAAQSVVKK